VTEERANELIRYEMIAAPGLKSYWEIQFAPGSQSSETEVREVMRATITVQEVKMLKEGS